MYKIFSSRTANLKDALGLPSVRKSRYSEFWAVRDIDLELAPGQRLGIIGRNGAGKSTILKLITQNVAPTEGTVSVQGQVQALLDTGGGLHPEFTGEENIEASLNLPRARHRGGSGCEGRHRRVHGVGPLSLAAVQDVLDRNAGQACVRNRHDDLVEILIVDEILGAGDAYFFGKSISRMQRLLESGASCCWCRTRWIRSSASATRRSGLIGVRLSCGDKAPRSSRGTRSSFDSSRTGVYAPRTRRRRLLTTTPSTAIPRPTS